MIRALIFDVDGTLAETEEAHRQAFNVTFKQAGLDWHWSKELYRDLLKVTGGKERMNAYQAGLTQAHPFLNEAQIADLHQQKTRRYGQILAEGHLSLRPGVETLINRARNSNIRLAIATTTNIPNVDALIQCCWNLPAHEVFEVIAAGDEVDTKKPAPDVYLLALERLGLGPQDCIAIEDSRNGVLSAKAAKIPVLTAPSWYTSGDDVSKSDWLVEDLTDPLIAQLLGTQLVTA
ncbi:HAD family hydrolase [Cohaesibacter gelatinilyticus]|uniref:Haloacid dehalogenase superfamily, subfamily IA, variant 3 with third motif having DD or ED n=1 Tax=Cohaesibacter gelatinilyticus TaxID=372072 RepID=A0A285PF00_9HYPH|nr:HAD family hydrolase [Cohaesibacter gelatinilyticus]SNZ20299.1 haloacid dehalogenase superfamily, subfamily IA, variant 3 with third motif having DD or ED [Cohaesibacter gelatinilyticus]